MTDPREARFCELLEAPDLSPDDWDELERLGRELDLLDDLQAYVVEELVAELDHVQGLH